MAEGMHEASALGDEGKVKTLADALRRAGREVSEPVRDEEWGTLRLTVDSLTRRVGEVTLDSELLSTPAYKNVVAAYQEIEDLHAPPFLLARNGTQESVVSREALFNLLLESGKKGLSIQRYKGLGEMNPDQLWGTTMNPETRKLLQVRIDDLPEAETIFSRLMGDEVEPRRQFIQDNALEVQNLDI